MRPVYLYFTDEKNEKTKTFVACSLKTGTMDNIFDIAERAENLEKENIKLAEVRAFYQDLKSLILTVFKYQFSFEELNENVEQEELMRVFNDLCEKIGGEIAKN